MHSVAQMPPVPTLAAPGPYASPFDIALYQLEMAVDNRADSSQISAIAERILPIVKQASGQYALPQDLTAVIEFQILMAIIDRCSKRGGGELLAPSGPFFLTSIFENHLKSGYYNSICQLASLATGMASAPTLHRLAHILEACPTPVLHAVFHSLSADYQVLCPKAFESVRKLSEISLPFASALAQGALMSARTMRLITFSTDQFNSTWLDVIVNWLEKCPNILTCSPTHSSSLIVSLSNFIVLVTTASAVVQTSIVNTNNANWLPTIDREALKKLLTIADKLNSSILLAAFSFQSSNQQLPKMSSSELTGLSFQLFTEAAHMIGVPTLIASLLDAPIIRLLQHIQGFRAAGIMPQVSKDDLGLLKTKFAPQIGGKLIDLICESL